MKLDKNYCWQLDGLCRNILFSNSDIYEYFMANSFDMAETVRYITSHCGCRADRPCYYVEDAINRARDDKRRWYEFFKGVDLSA